MWIRLLLSNIVELLHQGRCALVNEDFEVDIVRCRKRNIQEIAMQRADACECPVEKDCMKDTC